MSRFIPIDDPNHDALTKEHRDAGLASIYLEPDPTTGEMMASFYVGDEIRVRATAEEMINALQRVEDAGSTGGD